MGSSAPDFPLDRNVIAALPTGAQVFSSTRLGKSAWTETVHIAAQLADGTPAPYFLKCATGELGRLVMEGEFASMMALHKVIPDFVPRPYTWGKYHHDSPETYFFLSEFITMSHQTPDVEQLCSKLAQLHRTSRSPTGSFGLGVTSCHGRTPQDVGWEQSWTTFFTTLLKHAMDLDVELNGRWNELELLEERLTSQVIPALIGNLEQEGRTVKPCLIHGDLWEGNMGTSCETGNVYIFDAGAYYAHNEMEIGNWRSEHSKVRDKGFTQTYLQYYRPSEPVDQWDDRNRMYCTYFNFLYSDNHTTAGTAAREQSVIASGASLRLGWLNYLFVEADTLHRAYNDIYFLIDKYAPFIDGEGPPRLVHLKEATRSTETDRIAA